MRQQRRIRRSGLAVLAVLACCCGCTSLRDYVHNGFKVGPNYAPPPAPIERQWIDANDIRTSPGQDLSCWWKVFNDPTLDRLIACAYGQNLSLREAGFRVLEARARLAIAQGEFFPQAQNATGRYQREAISGNNAGPPPTTRFFNQWSLGFNLAWELDFWGRFRRAITSAQAQLDASVAGYDDVLVTLLGDVASNYVQIRTLQERIRWFRHNVEIQKLVLGRIRTRVGVGAGLLSELDVDQTESNLEQTEAEIPQLEIDLQQAQNRLCILLGIPPVDLHSMIGEDRIPVPPAEVVFDIPANLLRRRPDVRRAERLAAAQAEQIGIAEAELYPAFSILGTVGYQSQRLSNLFTSPSFTGSIGPAFQWNLLNYGRISNDVRFQDARFKELVVTYQNTVLQAQREVEDALVTFLRAQDRRAHLVKSTDAANRAIWRVTLLLNKRASDVAVNRFALIEQNRVTQQDLLAQTTGQIAEGLIETYRAMGGGWEMRLGPAPVPLPPVALPTMPPEGSEELQRVRELLGGQAPPAGPEKIERLPVPPAQPVQP